MCKSCGKVDQFWVQTLHHEKFCITFECSSSSFLRKKYIHKAETTRRTFSICEVPTHPHTHTHTQTWARAKNMVKRQIHLKFQKDVEALCLIRGNKQVRHWSQPGIPVFLKTLKRRKIKTQVTFSLNYPITHRETQTKT
jgi:hypothetical protein